MTTPVKTPKFRTADEIRGAATNTVTSLRKAMKDEATKFGDTIATFATEELFSIAEDDKVDGPYDKDGEAVVKLRLDELPDHDKVSNWLENDSKLPVQVRDILKEKITEKLEKGPGGKGGAGLEVVSYSLNKTRDPAYTYTRYIDGSFTLALTLRDPKVVGDPVLNGME